MTFCPQPRHTLGKGHCQSPEASLRKDSSSHLSHAAAKLNFLRSPSKCERHKLQQACPHSAACLQIKNLLCIWELATQLDLGCLLHCRFTPPCVLLLAPTSNMLMVLSSVRQSLHPLLLITGHQFLVRNIDSLELVLSLFLVVGVLVWMPLQSKR